MIAVLTFAIVFLLIGLLAYLVWALHMRLETMNLLHTALSRKVRDGEHVTIENFEIVQKSFKRIENEIKEIGRVEAKVKEANKAITRLERVSE
jgi:hypothetical protein